MNRTLVSSFSVAFFILYTLISPDILSANQAITHMSPELLNDEKVFSKYEIPKPFIDINDDSTIECYSVGDNIKYAVRRIPAKNKPSIVFIHGWAEASGTWRYIYPILAGEYNMYFCDLPGFGCSSKNIPALKEGESFIDIQADLFTELYNKLGLNEASTIIVAHSMGATIALQSLGDDSVNPAGLLLMSPLDYSLTKPPSTAKAIYSTPLVLARIASSFGVNDKMLLKGLLANVENKWAVSREYYEELLKSSQTKGALRSMKVASKTSILKGNMPWLKSKVEGLKKIAKSSTEIQLIWGDSDRLLPYSPDLWIVKQLHLTPVFIRNSGHIVQLDSPKSVSEAIILLSNSISEKK